MKQNKADDYTHEDLFGAGLENAIEEAMAEDDWFEEARVAFERLNKIKQSTGITIAKLSKVLSLNDSTLYGWLTQRKKPRYDAWLKLKERLKELG